MSEFRSAKGFSKWDEEEGLQDLGGVDAIAKGVRRNEGS